MVKKGKVINFHKLAFFVLIISSINNAIGMNQELQAVNWDKEFLFVQANNKDRNNGLLAVINAGMPAKIEKINQLQTIINYLNPGKPQLPPQKFDLCEELNSAHNRAELGKTYSLQEMVQLALSEKIMEIKRLKQQIPVYEEKRRKQKEQEAQWAEQTKEYQKLQKEINSLFEKNL